MSSNRTLPIDAAGKLAHALAARAAEEVHVRALSLKGAFAAEYGLRARRASADADILTDPDSIGLLCQRLEDRGWHTRAGRMPPTFIDLHSVTLIHDQWPCDLDVHRFFPGFFAPAHEIFELLWRSRDVHRTTGGEVFTPSRAGMAVIVALHAARSPHVEKSRSDIASVSDAIATRFSAAEIAEFCEIVRVGRAQWVLRELIADVGLPLTDDDASPAEKAVWSKNQQAAPDKATSLWIREILDAPAARKHRVLLHALWVPRDQIPRNDPERLPSYKESWSYQRARWMRGLRGLVGYIRR